MAPWKTRMTIIGTRAAPQFLTLIQAPRTDRTGETCPRWSTGWVDPYRLWSMTKKRTRKSTEIYGNLWKSMDEDESNIRAFEYAPQRQMTNFRYLGQWWIKKLQWDKNEENPWDFQRFKKNPGFTGWWFQMVSTPLKNISQMGWWHSQFMESHKIHVPVTTNQILWTIINHHKPSLTISFTNGFTFRWQTTS